MSDKSKTVNSSSPHHGPVTKGSPSQGHQAHGTPGHSLQGSPSHGPLHAPGGHQPGGHHGHALDHDGHDHADEDVELTEAEIWEKEKQDLKTKLSELEEFKGKYENEKKENQMLQNRLSELMAGQSDATQRLMKTNDSLDRLKLDHTKKVEQIEKMQRDISFKDDRIRNLEIRASEVEKAELILETTKSNLESTVVQVRARDGEIRKLNKDIDDYARRLEQANAKIKESEERVEDLKIQVRHELLKNDNIEKNLEMIPRLKDTIEEREKTIKEQQRELEKKTALLSAARRAVRDYKERLRVLEREIIKTEELKEDLDISQSEVITLKKLMYGKDYLVTQKSKALDLSKEIIEVMNDSQNNDHTQRIQQLLDRVATPSVKFRESSTSSFSREESFSYLSDLESRPQSTPPRFRSTTPSPGHHREISVNNHPYSTEDGHKKHQNGRDRQQFLNKIIVDTPGKRKRPVSAMAPEYRSKSPIHRTSSLKEAQKVYTQPLPRKSNTYETEIVLVPNCYKSDKGLESKNKPSLEYKIGSHAENENCDKTSAGSISTPRDSMKDSSTTENALSDTDSAVHSDDTDYDEEVTPEQDSMLRSFTAREKDEFLSDIINVGDRVLFKRPQTPPRYGKRRAAKPLIQTGIVKFVGKFDADKYDARTQVGVRMDEPVGDTDGTVKGKRYMYTPADQGKFYKLREITSILNVKTGRYVPMRKILAHHIQRLKTTSRTHQKHTAEAH